jgi:hypothetical protein
MPKGPGYGAGIAELISASPAFTHLVAVADDVQDWLSCGPGAGAVTVTVGGAVSARAAGATAIAAAPAPVTNTAVM